MRFMFETGLRGVEGKVFSASKASSALAILSSDN